MNKKEINILILRSFSEDISEKDQKLLALWLSESAENREYYDKLKVLWSSIKTPVPGSIPDFEDFWFQFEPKLSYEINKANQTENFEHRSFISKIFGKKSYAIGGAISAASLVLLACFYIFIFNKPRMLYYSTANAQQIEVELPDGSKVKLNSGSRISFPDKFADSRDIELNGEAYFSVTKTGVPFIVHTSNASVQVKGTKFNVKARDNKTGVTVTEGAVLLKSSNQANTAQVLLHAGESSVCENNNPPEKSVITNQIPWLNNTLYFENATLKEISGELTRRFNTEIRISDSEIESMKLTGEFRQQNIDEILKTICLSLNLKYKYEGRSYLLYK